MAKFQVIFCDSIYDTQVTQFDTFDDAVEYWQTYADVDTCFAGELKDLDNGEIIWDFDDATPCDVINDRT